jgi:hypothetical protein
MAFQSVSSVNSIAILDAYTNKILSGYRPEGFIADDVFKDIPCDVITARIPHTNATLALNSQLEISPTGFPTVQLNFTSTDVYAIKSRGVQAFLEPHDVVQLGGDAQSKAIVSYQLADYVDIQKEYALASAIFNPLIMTQNFSTPIVYDDPTSDPGADFIKARSIVVGGVGTSYGCGLEANTAIMNWQTFNQLIQHPALLKQTFQTATGGAKTIGADKLAEIMGVKRLLIAAARYDSSEQGPTSTPIYTPLWGNSILFYRKDENPSPAMATQSLGYKFIPNGATLPPADAFWQYNPYQLLPSMGRYYARMKAYDMHVSNVYAGCLITGVTSAAVNR